MKKLFGIVVLGLFWCNFINAANANIYWVYEFYKVSPQSNIFIIADSSYQECLKSQLSEKEYNKAIKIESNMSKKMEKIADTCVEKLLISQKNSVLQECLKNELSEERYNNLIVNSFLKKPKKNDFKVFQKCLFNLKTLIVDNSSNQTGSCPEGYILKDNSCQLDKSRQVAKQSSNQTGSCPEGYILKDNSCQLDKSKKVAKQKSKNILSDEEAYGSKKSYANEWIAIMDEIILLIKESETSNKQKYTHIINNANSIFKMMENSTLEQKKLAGKELILVKTLIEENFANHKNAEKYKDILLKVSGIMIDGRPPTDIFLANKVYDCKNRSKPFFTHQATDLSKIKEIQPWGSVRTGGGCTKCLKNHTYFISKKKGTEFSLYAPTDSYLIGYDSYYLYESPTVVQHMLYFQASCDIAYRFDHLDKIEQSLKNKIGNLVLQSVQGISKIIPIKPPIFIKGGQLVAKTKGVPTHHTGGFDFGLYNKNNNNQLPKRLLAHKGTEEEKIFRFADCPYDYFIEDLKKAYYKKIKKKICGPKEIQSAH